jgi:rod shape-determining protein MreC
MRTLTRRQRIAAAVLAVVALMFITLDFTGGSLAGARSGSTGALGSLYRGTDGLLGPLRRFVQGIPDVGSNRAEIAKLRRENADLRRSVTADALDAGTARRLATLQLQATARSWQVMPARVVGTGPGAGFQWTLTLDAGSREHVLAGQTVTDGAALLGRVVAVYPTTSVVLLAADPTSGVGVRDTRSGDLLLAAGAASAGLLASPIDDHPDVKVGDQLITGPAGRTTFADGLPVGRVSAVTTSTAGTVRVAVRPAGSQTGVDLVGIVLQQPRTVARPPVGSGTSQ